MTALPRAGWVMEMTVSGLPSGSESLASTSIVTAVVPNVVAESGLATGGRLTPGTQPAGSANCACSGGALVSRATTPAAKIETHRPEGLMNEKYLATMVVPPLNVAPEF